MYHTKITMAFFVFTISISSCGGVPDIVIFATIVCWHFSLIEINTICVLLLLPHIKLNYFKICKIVKNFLFY